MISSLMLSQSVEMTQMWLQTSTDLSCLNPQIQAIIDNDDSTYKGINMSLHANCCPPPRLMHTKISNIRRRRCKTRQIIIALKSTWLSPSPLRNK